MTDTATLMVDGQNYSLPIIEGSEGERAVDIRALRAQSGLITLDPGYGNTGSCESAITYIDGERGILRYRGIPIEQFENSVPLLITEKSLIPDSGGAGKFRGGPAQRVAFEVTSDQPVTMTIRHERVKFPPRGLLGGLPGAAGREFVNGEQIPSKVRMDLQPHDRVTFDTPGGGGLGPPTERDHALLKADLESGLVSPENARKDYGLDKGEVDGDA